MRCLPRTHDGPLAMLTDEADGDCPLPSLDSRIDCENPTSMVSWRKSCSVSTYVLCGLRHRSRRASRTFTGA